MTKRYGLMAPVLAALALYPSPIEATVIDFAGYQLGQVFNGPLTVGDATFASGSDVLKIVNFGGGNALCGFDGSGCGQSVSISFAPGVSDFAFSFSGDSEPNSRVFFGGQTPALSFTGQAFGDGRPATVQTQLVGFRNLELITLIPTESSRGIAFNSVAFSSGVPEPLSWTMMLAGFGGLGLALRYRKNKASVRTAHAI